MLHHLIGRYKSLPMPVRASAWFACCSFFQRGISVVTAPIFTRLLSRADYGQYSVFNSWLSIISVFVTMNLSSGMFLQGIVKFSDQKERFASAVEGLCTTLTTGWLVVYLLFRDFWNDIFSLTTVQMLAMLLIIWSSAMVGFWSIRQRTDYHYRKLVLLTVLVSVAAPIVEIFLVLHAEDRVTARILGLALVNGLAYAWIFFAQLRRDHTFFSGNIWHYALKFNLPLIPHYLATAVLSGADRIMIENMVGASEAGLYSLAYSVSQIMMIFNTALLQTLEPWLYKKIAVKDTAMIPTVAYPAFTGIALANLFLIGFAPEVIAIFAPPSYYDAIWVIPPVAMSVFFMFTYSFFAAFEFYYEKTLGIMLATVVGAALNVSLNAVFIPKFGYYVAGYTTLACYALYAFAHYLFMRRLCMQKLQVKDVYDVRILLGIAGGFMAVGFVLLSTYRFPLLRFALVVCLLGLLFVLRRRIAAELRRWMDMRKNH